MENIYMENQDFAVVAGKSWQEAKFYPCCPEPWPELFFTFNLRRHPRYYVDNLILPTVSILIASAR
jgi:hypothetical protein